MSDITNTTTNDEIYQMVTEYVDTTKCSGEEGDGYMQSLFDARKAARRFQAEYAACLATGRRYEATGNVMVFGGVA